MVKAVTIRRLLLRAVNLRGIHYDSLVKNGKS